MTTSTGKKPEVAKEPVARDSAEAINVKNISGKTLFLSGGKVEDGKTGKATVAELTCLSKFIEEVKG